MQRSSNYCNKEKKNLHWRCRFWISFLKNNGRLHKKRSFKLKDQKKSGLSRSRPRSLRLVLKRRWPISKINDHSTFKRRLRVCPISTQDSVYQDKDITYRSNSHHVGRDYFWADVPRKHEFWKLRRSAKSIQFNSKNGHSVWNGFKNIQHDFRRGKICTKIILETLWFNGWRNFINC